jgi:hypothetical protein
LIQAFNKKLSIIEAQRLTDSIKKVALEKTTFFKTTDNLKRPRKTTTGVARKDSLRLEKKKQILDALNG